MLKPAAASPARHVDGVIAWPYPRLMVHRCGGALAPENTLAGLAVTAALGGRGVEFDVMLSADDEPFLIHDETLERTTNGTGQVAATPAARLRTLDAGVRHHAAFTGEPLPAFELAMDRCLALGLAANVEIKPARGREARTGQVVAERAAAGWQGAALPPLLSSFSAEALLAAAEAAPDLPRGWLVERLPADWRDTAAALGVVALHASAAHLQAHQARAVREAGLHLVVYTENDPRQAARFFDAWGVATLITDRPDLFAPGF